MSISALGDISSSKIVIDFPYHSPSVISSLSDESVAMPDCIGYILLQVCAIRSGHYAAFNKHYNYYRDIYQQKNFFNNFFFIQFSTNYN